MEKWWDYEEKSIETDCILVDLFFVLLLVTTIYCREERGYFAIYSAQKLNQKSSDSPSNRETKEPVRTPGRQTELDTNKSINKLYLTPSLLITFMDILMI